MIKLLDKLDILISVDENLSILQELVVNAAASGKFGIDDQTIRDNFQSEELDPINWEIVKVEEIAEFTNGYAFKSSDYRDDGIGIIRMSDLKYGEISVQQLKYVSKSFLSELNSAIQVKPNDLVIGMSGSIGRPCFNRTEKTFLLNQRVGKLTPNLGLVTPEYLAISLASLEQHFLQISMGSAIKNLSTAQIKQTKILLPPLAIQKVIVNHYEKFLSLTKSLKASLSSDKSAALKFRNSVIDAVSSAQSSDDLQVAWQRIQQNWELITGTTEAVDSIRTLILDLAVRGDLVRMDYSESFETIEWSIPELKLDESKLWYLPTLREEKKHGWSRIPLAKIGSWGSGGTPTSSRKEYYQNGTISWAVIGDLNNDIMMTTETKITNKALLESSSKLIPEGSILIAMYGASIGKTAMTGIECCTNQAIAHCIVDTNFVSKEYFFFVARSLKRHLIQEGKGAAQPNISQSVLKHLIIDLPPRPEQDLIVDTVSALMKLCDELDLALRRSESIVEKFSRSIVSASA